MCTNPRGVSTRLEGPRGVGWGSCDRWRDSQRNGMGGVAKGGAIDRPSPVPISRPVKGGLQLQDAMHTCCPRRHPMRPAQLGGTSRAAGGGLCTTASVWAASAVIALRAVIVGAKVHCLAAEGAAVVDELLVFLDGHCEGCGYLGVVYLAVAWCKGGRGCSVLIVVVSWEVGCD